MASITITESELLAALADAAGSEEGAPEEAKTSQEIAASSGVSHTRVMKGLRELHQQGRLVSHRVRRQGIDGRNALVTAYTISPA
jgi:hypothetical protein